MSQQSEFVPRELRELQTRIEALPNAWRRELAPFYERLSAWNRQQNHLVQTAQEAVEQLQLDVKYLYFDLDATRRERDELRQQLESG